MSLSSSGISDITNLIKILGSIKHINLKFNSINCESIKLLAANLHNLPSLNLLQNNLRDDDVKILCKSPETNNTLLSLNLSHNQIHNLDYLSRMLLINTTLTSLKLNNIINPKYDYDGSEIRNP